jgi:hypothetical protein
MKYRLELRNLATHSPPGKGHWGLGATEAIIAENEQKRKWPSLRRVAGRSFAFLCRLGPERDTADHQFDGQDYFC